MPTIHIPPVNYITSMVLNRNRNLRNKEDPYKAKCYISNYNTWDTAIAKNAGYQKKQVKTDFLGGFLFFPYHSSTQWHLLTYHVEHVQAIQLLE